MRIAIISDLKGWSWAGCEELWLALAKSALHAGHKVAVFLSRGAIPAHKIQPLQEMGLELSLPGGGARIADIVRNRVSWKLGALVAQASPSFVGLQKFASDVTFINGGDALPLTEFLSGLRRSGALNSPYVIVCHNSYLFGHPIDRSTQETIARYYQGAQRVLFVARRTHKETEHLLAAKLARASIVRNPVNLDCMSPVAMPTGSTVRIASLGRLVITSKGHDILLAALGSPQFKDRDWMLSIYGDGPHLQQLKVLSEHYQIAERVAFKGYSNDVRAVWADSHLLAMPSRVESSPLTLVEAMLCGRPSVVNDVGEVREWTSEPETGFISEGTDIESFVDALERAWSARAEWVSIGQRAREKALQMIDPDPGGTVLKILEEVAAGRRAGTRTELQGAPHA
jgi:glycosyltransferase involved in cell wall biosynthesis